MTYLSLEKVVGMSIRSTLVRVARLPVGVATADDWAIDEGLAEDPSDGELVVAVEYVSLNPAMRNWLRDTPGSQTALRVGDVMRAEAVGRVVISRDPNFGAGDAVFGMLGVQEHVVVSGKRVVPVDESLAPARAWLGTLGYQGLSAWFGLHDIGQVRSEETVVVSGAAGAVGSIAGQLAKIAGATSIGIVGDSSKAQRIVDELGFDVAIARSAGDVSAQLRELVPNGVDIAFDNVGGEVLDAMLAHLAVGARVVLCGATSQYNDDGPMRGPSNYFALVRQRARMEGFLITDYWKRHQEGRVALAGLLADGRLTGPDHVLGRGIASFPAALTALFSGANFGKALLQVVPDSDGGG
jgi:NADPH-dependent curcumin reductase CurA